MYQLSRAHEAQAKPEKALAVLDQMVAKYPQSQWYTEAQFRRGEILFSAGRYHDAELAYGAVIKAGSEGDFYEQGLYKHGWSLFKQSRGEESVASFLKVLDRVLIRDGKLRERDSLTRPERELSEDTLRVMAITFSDLDGPETLDALLKQRGADPVYGAHAVRGARQPLHHQGTFPGRSVGIRGVGEAPPGRSLRAVAADADDRGLPEGWLRVAGAGRQAGVRGALRVRLGLLAIAHDCRRA
jgi:tetratricopeptide (TPR) repeat protein